jgi:hypothetical protein
MVADKVQTVARAWKGSRLGFPGTQIVEILRNSLTNETLRMSAGHCPID